MMQKGEKQFKIIYFNIEILERYVNNPKFVIMDNGYRGNIYLKDEYIDEQQYAEVPSKMHIFYREAFEVLAKRHDASKGSYKRALRTGLSVDAFVDYFAELCFRSYNDEKFEMTAEEFDGYFSQLNARIAANDKKTTASDFREDLCSNLCLMYFEGNSYYFAHRSFQEYFCALFYSKQKDKFISRLDDFFEKHQRRMFGDRTFYMLYDMVTEKVEEYIFLPFLTSLFKKCDES